MKKAVKLLALVLAAALAAMCFTGCDLIEAEEEVKPDPLTRAVSTDETITLPEGMNPEAHFESQFTETGMTIVFNRINPKDTEYFTAPGGSLTIRAKASGEAKGMKSFKISLWKKVEKGAEYIEDSTIYFYTEGNDPAGSDMHTYTIEGLDPAAQYRLNLSYDAYGYYIFGQMQVDGAAPLPAPAQ